MLRILLLSGCIPELAVSQVSFTGVSFVQIGNAKIAPLENVAEESTVEVTKQNENEIIKQRRIASNRVKSVNTTISNELEKRLETAAAASQKLRRRISMCTVGVGAVCSITSSVMSSLLINFVVNPNSVGRFGYYTIMTPFSIALAFLGVMPNDAFLIRLVHLISLVLTPCTGMLFAVNAAYVYFGQPEVPVENSTDSTLYVCGNDAPNTGCALYVVRSLGFPPICFAVSWFTYRNLARYEGVQWWDQTKQPGTRFNDKAFKLPARVALNEIWRIFRFAFLAVGVWGVGLSLGLHLAADQAPFYPTSDFIADTINYGLWCSCFFLFSDDRRRIFMAFLISTSMEGEANVAATVAALLGNSNASDSLALAKERFCAISFADLAKEDFAKSTEDESRKNRLFGLTKKVKLGACDAFLSHSWHDNGEKKFSALQKWALAFKENNNRDPVIWLDKACIDQTNIADDLLCLPIFTAGCQTLLIVAGPTYVSRLWCIIEIFIFTRMGGGTDRITVVPIDMTEKEAKKQFSNADARESKCSVETDRQKLLGIIEQGFGDFHGFNEILRHVFAALDTNITKFTYDVWKNKNASVGTEMNFRFWSFWFPGCRDFFFLRLRFCWVCKKITQPTKPKTPKKTFSPPRKPK